MKTALMVCSGLALGGTSQLEMDACTKHIKSRVGLSIKTTREEKNQDGKWSSFLMLILDCQRPSFIEKDQEGLGCSNS